jgi:inosine-uridine nucleoside N-ribohydrolase
MEKKLMAQQTFGMDGLNGVPNWPPYPRPVYPLPGYMVIAQQTLEGYMPVLVVTGPLTDVALAIQSGEFQTSGLNNIIMRGCLDSATTPCYGTDLNEDSIKADPEAAKIVLETMKNAQKPVILVEGSLAKNLQWSAKATKILKEYQWQTQAAYKMWEVSTAVPTFNNTVNDEYAVDGLIAAASLSDPGLFEFKRYSLDVDVEKGEIIITNDTYKNVYVLSMSEKNQNEFFSRALECYLNGPPSSNITGKIVGGVVGGIALVAILGVIYFGYKKYHRDRNEETRPLHAYDI